MMLVRNFVGVTAYGYAARKVVVDASLRAARTREDLPDIINVALEELARHHRDRMTAVEVGEHRDETVLHGRTQQIDISPFVANGQVDRKTEIVELTHANLNWNKSSFFSNTRSASKESRCHLRLWS